ncbi:MAG: hypothetical protein WC755_05475 [Candidatus Woesearchaeota archaeon]
MTQTEGLAKINVEIKDIVSKKMDVFYNIRMKENRDLTILLLNCLDKKEMKIMSPLAGSGVREIRFLKELKEDNIKKIIINDYSKNAYNLIKENLELNNIKYNEDTEEKSNSEEKNKHEENIKVIVQNLDANKCIIENLGFDFAEIDPFGNPNPFLNNIILGLSRGGILAITATDTSSLCGTYKKTCMRHYFATPLNCYLKHELGVRILIRKVQLIGAQFEKALTPIFSYAKEHYMRVFFICEKQKTATDNIIKQHKFLSLNEKDGTYKWGIHGQNNTDDNNDNNKIQKTHTLIGPMWSGELWDKELVNKMCESDEKESKLNNKKENKLLHTIKNEMNYPPLYYNTHILSKLNGQAYPPKSDGFDTTHFDKHCVKSNLTPKEFIEQHIKKQRETK